MGLLQRVWQWIKRFWGQLLGGTTARRSGRGEEDESTRPLSDTDYEFLFSQLLDGVAHGWHEGRIVKYFEQLGERGKPKLWVAWLERFGEKVLASPAPNLQLAARMMRLGELAQSFAQTEALGEVSYHIGRQLYTREAGAAVWEFEGPDVEVTTATTEEILSPTEKPWLPADGVMRSEPPSPETVENLTIEELSAKLQQDSQLAEQLAQQLGLDSVDPQIIIESLIAQFQASQGQVDAQSTPESVEDWFERGLQQANLGDLEGAIASWDKALDLNPTMTQAWHNRGSALGQLGRLEEALTSFDHALELDPDDFQTWNAKGNVYYNLQQWQAALACWDKTIALQPNYYQAWYNRGSTLESLGKPEDAIASYRQALAIQPDFEPAQSRMRELGTRG